MSQKLDRLKELLRLEDKEARARAKELGSDSAMEAAGRLVRRAEIEDEVAALHGRFRVRFTAEKMSLFSARAGSVVYQRGKDENGNWELHGRGVVIRRRRQQLVVAFEHSLRADLDYLGKSELVDLVLGHDDVSISRMMAALDFARGATGPEKRLLNALLGDKNPEPIQKSEISLFDRELHEDQEHAVGLGVLSEELALILGPPGTGKTRVLVEIVRQCVARGQRVLCLCASNAAIDHLALSLLRADKGLSLARAGDPARAHDDLEAHSLSGLTQKHELRVLARKLFDDAFQLQRGGRRRSDTGREAYRRQRESRAEAGKLFADARRLERQATDEVIRKTKVLCGTLTGFAKELPNESEFDVLVVDEASQVLTPALLCGLGYAPRVVLAGDHKQLPPTVLSKEAKKELSRTVFHELMEADGAGDYAHMLRVQHRMHGELMQFSSVQFYEEKLLAHESVANQTLALKDSMSLLPSRPLDVIDTAGAGFSEAQLADTQSFENPGEGKLISRLVVELLEHGLSPEQIGVITPYSAQRALLLSLLDERIEVDSVDGFQGREKEVILFSSVRSNHDGQIGFLKDPRRLNVAITRAKKKLFLIGDSATLSTSPLWRALFDDAMAREAYRSVFEIEGAVDL